jgi:L-seryl-tRNA(Ser) seleniumtransferase
MTNPYRGLPSVDKLLQHPAIAALRDRFPADRVAMHSRSVLQGVREVIGGGEASDGPKPDANALSITTLAAAVVESLEATTRPSLIAAINATGVILHTNLGRAPLSTSAIEAMATVGRGYSNLEFDLAAGRRGSRLTHLEGMLRETIGAQAGIAVNNNASALLLTLSALARDREVIISRGQAVEIGGGFRIPDVCRQSGATLVEVGTTNRTRSADYRDAISDNTAAILRVHSSNFRVVGFTEEPALEELHTVARERDVLLLDDIGSGCLLDATAYGLAPEPRPQDSLTTGVDLTMFSGDKLLGGPQAGIIAGRADLIDIIKRHPLARAVRTDKATIAALAATFTHYVAGDAETKIPVWRMISAPADAIRSRADAWQAALGVGVVQPAESMIGGGSLPGETLPSYALTLPADEFDPNQLSGRLRLGDPPVVARVAHDALWLDPRTVLPEDDAPLLAALRAALSRD